MDEPAECDRDRESDCEGVALAVPETVTVDDAVPVGEADAVRDDELVGDAVPVTDASETDGAAVGLRDVVALGSDPVPETVRDDDPVGLADGAEPVACRVPDGVKLGVTHSTRRFQPALGLHRPLWFGHQWHTPEVLVHTSGRKRRASHSAAQRGAAKASVAATQYCRPAHQAHHPEQLKGCASSWHRRHAVSARWPGSGLCVAAGHRRHPADEDSPSFGLYVPAWHAVHWL